MNFIAVRGTADGVEVDGRVFAAPNPALAGLGALTLGVRPEYVQLAAEHGAGAVPGVVTQAQDIGTYWLITARIGAGEGVSLLRARLSPEQAIPRVGDSVWLSVVGPHTCYYKNEELVA